MSLKLDLILLYLSLDKRKVLILFVGIALHVFVSFCKPLTRDLIHAFQA